MNRSVFRRTAVVVAIGAAIVVLAACASAASTRSLPPVTLVPNVDLPRFMGDWYVIASIPTRFEKGDVGAKDSYRLAADGSIDVTYHYREGSLAAPPKELRSRAFVQAPGNAVWGVRFVWPIEADYRISYLADDYGQTVITREKRDYVWIMARTPTIAEADYQRLLGIVAREGYDPAQVQRVVQQTEERKP